MTTDQELPDNGEDDDLDLPSVHASVEFAIGVALDVENNLDPEHDPFDQVLSININAGQLLNLCWLLVDLYATIEDLSDDYISELEEHVKVSKRVMSNAEPTIH